MLITIAIAVGIMFATCKKNVENDPNPNDPLTEKEKQEIISNYEEIDKKASKILLEDGTVEDFEKLVPEIQNYPMVEKVWVESNSLWIKFKKGGVICWNIINEDIVPPYIELNIKSKVNGTSNNKVCLINQQFNDENRPFCREIITELNGEFRNNGFDVTIKNGEQANVNFFKNDFNKYGVIYCITHGCYDTENKVAWLFTGDENTDKLYFEYYDFTKNKQMGESIYKEKREGKEKTVHYIMISNKFFDVTYTQNSFPNTMFYWTACQGMKTDDLGKVLSKKGAGVTIGWNEINCSGKFVGIPLFKSLLNGFTLQEAFDALPAESKVDYCAVASGAKLVYYPTSGGNMKLSSENGLKITSPKYGTIYHCGEWVDVYVSGYTGADWRQNLKVQVWCLDGEPQPSNPNEPYSYTGDLYDRKEEDYSFTFSPENPSVWNGHWAKLVAINKKDGTKSAPQYIRIGTLNYEEGIVINGVRWATRNVDMPGTFASKPEDAGMFYQWGSNVGWSSKDPLEASDGINTWRDLSEKGNVWKSDKDPCPPGWRVPTVSEWQSLVNAGSSWKTIKGVNGRVFGSDPNTIFLPAVTGRVINGKLDINVGSQGYYWSCTQDSNRIYRLNFTSGSITKDFSSCTDSRAVRCVSE